jgi:hypothetical protein
MSRQFIRRWTALIQAVFAACLACTFVGCGPDYYPVTGTITLHDGSPLTKGLVIFERIDEGPPMTARGEIQPDGRYSLSTEQPGDGMPVGRYKVVINPLDTSDVPDEQKVLPFDVKHLNINTSELEFEVKPEPNVFDIKLSPRRKR